MRAYARCLHIVMAGLVPAIHALPWCPKNVDARDKPGHDEFVARWCRRNVIRLCDCP